MNIKFGAINGYPHDEKCKIWLKWVEPNGEDSKYGFEYNNLDASTAPIIWDKLESYSLEDRNLSKDEFDGLAMMLQQIKPIGEFDK